MINVSELIHDPDFAQNFQVIRRPGKWSEGKWVIENPQQFNLHGVITVASARDINMVPEGERIKGMMSFYSTEPLYTTRVENSTAPSQISDELLWRGEKYKIIKINPHIDWGFYQALAVRVVGN